MTPAELMSAVRARLDETERVARASQDCSPTPWRAVLGYEPAVYDDLNTAVARFTDVLPEATHSLIDDDAQHIALHDPAAVLRFVTAVRQILDRYEFVTGHGPAVDHVRALDMTTGAAAALYDVVRLLADGLGIDLEETPQ